MHACPLACTASSRLAAMTANIINVLIQQLSPPQLRLVKCDMIILCSAASDCICIIDGYSGQMHVCLSAYSEEVHWFVLACYAIAVTR